MIVIFPLISLIFLLALVVAPLSVVAVSIAVWGRRHEATAPGTSDVAHAAPTGGARTS